MRSTIKKFEDLTFNKMIARHHKPEILKISNNSNLTPVIMNIEYLLDSKVFGSGVIPKGSVLLFDDKCDKLIGFLLNSPLVTLPFISFIRMDINYDIIETTQKYYFEDKKYFISKKDTDILLKHLGVFEDIYVKKSA